MVKGPGIDLEVEKSIIDCSDLSIMCKAGSYEERALARGLLQHLRSDVKVIGDQTDCK